MSTKDYRGKEIIISLKKPGEDPAAKKNARGFIPPTRRPGDPLSRRVVGSVTCTWSRSWQYAFEDYRVWTASPAGVPVIFNGTRFSNRSIANVDPINEVLSMAQGVSAATTGLVVVEPFDANALPLSGSITFTFNRATGVGSLTTPTGTYSINAAPAAFDQWFGVFQFRNTFLTVLLNNFGAGPTLNYDVAPNWVAYATGLYRISRYQDVFTIAGVNVLQDNSQAFDYVDGSYIPPIPSPCDPATADAQAELARASFAAELAGYAHLRNIVFGPAQTP